MRRNANEQESVDGPDGIKFIDFRLWRSNSETVIYNTDMVHEDVFSALFLLSHPNVDMRATNP